MWRVSFALIIALSGCGDECRKYSDFSCSHLKSATYSVQFGYPRGDRVETIGTVSGLGACGQLAWGYAESKGMARADWSYVCCLHAKGSTCYEKHR